MNPQREILPNGMVLVTSEQAALPLVSVELLIRAGSRYDPADRHGLANLTSRLLTRARPRTTPWPSAAWSRAWAPTWAPTPAASWPR